MLDFRASFPQDKISFVFYREVFGYIDEIQGAKAVVNGRFRPMKFFVNNSHGRRVQVLLWNDLISTHEKDVTINRVVGVEGALCKSTFGNYFHEEQSLVPFKLNIQRHTAIKFYQTFDPNEAEIGDQIQDATLDDDQDISKFLFINRKRSNQPFF